MLPFVMCLKLLLLLSMQRRIIKKSAKKDLVFLFSENAEDSIFFHIEAKLSLKNARLPPIFSFDFNSPC